jgi:hypothetical protein
MVVPAEPEVITPVSSDEIKVEEVQIQNVKTEEQNSQDIKH